MPLCVHCSEPLTCTCKREQPIGESIIGCPASKKPGAIWVHVTNDIGQNIEGVPVLLFPQTNAMGLTVRESLAPNKYDVELAAPEQSGLAATYDFPTLRKKSVNVRNGTISYVAFLLIRKSNLLVSIVFKSTRRAFQEAGIDVSIGADFHGSGPSPDDRKGVNGVVDFGLVSAGNYTLTPTFTGVDAGKFDFETGPKPVDLLPGVTKTVEFEVEPRAQLKVEVVLKRAPNSSNPRKLLEVPVIAVKAQCQGTTALAANTDKGIADFGWVTPGKYTITPDFSVLKDCEYDWTDDPCAVELKPGSAETVEFQVEPLYQKVQFIAHCLLTIPKQIFVPSQEDLQDRVTVTELNGKRTFAFKEQRVQQGIWAKNELKPQLPYEKAELKTKPDGSGTLTLKKKKGENTYWTLQDLPPTTLDPQKISVTQSNVTSTPNIYDIKFLPMFANMPYELKDLTGQWMAKYHGHPDDKTDIDARVAFIKDTLSKASAKASQDATVLKVFIIPECFFQGLYGAYLGDDATYLVDELLKLVQGEEWKDWVFSFGTVNSVFRAAPLQGVKYTREIYEMTNRAPVIRGGLGASNSSDVGSTRMIRKVLNSAELADDIIPDPLATKRIQAINQDVQFSATEDEIRPGNLLARLLEEEKANGGPGKLFARKGLPVEWWGGSQDSGLLGEMNRILSIWGMARVIREIRVSENSAVDTNDLKKWTFCANESASVNRKTCLLSPEEAALLLIQTQWTKDYRKEPLLKSTWEDDISGKRVAVLSSVSKDLENLANECGFRLKYQHVALKAKIQDLVTNIDTTTKDIGSSAAQRLLFKPGMFPLWKILLELYAADKNDDAPLNYSKESFKLKDYCFAGPRKAGPWFATLAEAKNLKPCKRLVFGLEICADHADYRLGLINTGNDKTDIDIQLVPSAGMPPVYFAARKGGFIFNCDGWNKKPTEGGKTIEVHFDGPSPFSYKNEAGYTVDVSPVYPHSAVGKREDDAKPAVGKCLKPDDKVNPDPLSVDLSKVIFADGPGELHFYDLEELPK